MDHARTTRTIAVAYRNRCRFARLRLRYPAGRRSEARLARAWRSDTPGYATYDAHLAMELIVGTSELPARKRDLVVILTEYRWFRSSWEHLRAGLQRSRYASAGSFL